MHPCVTNFQLSINIIYSAMLYIEYISYTSSKKLNGSVIKGQLSNAELL
jgi:hypothetical protein